MKLKTVVIDANVAVKMLHAEADTEVAKAFFRSCIENEVKIVVPELFLYEVVNVCHRVKVNIEDVLRFYKGLKSSLLTVTSPNGDAWKRAQVISREGNEKSGFPDIYDSIYHAIALELGTIFVTADRKHFLKASQHGGIQMLADWEQL